MIKTEGSTLQCYLKLAGVLGCKLDESNNLIYVERILTSVIVLPCGLIGLKGTGFSGLDLEVLKFNKNLVNFESTSLANCNKLRELYVYKSQLNLVQDLKHMYSDLKIIERKEIL